MRAFTHQFVAPHTEAQIDLIWLPAVDLLALTSVQILAHGISDHAPILMGCGTPSQTQRPMWSFSMLYLTKHECVDFIDQELKNYFRENTRPVASPMTLWGAGKPSLRRIIKGYARGREARQAQRIAGLESRIADLKRQALWSDGGELNRMSLYADDILVFLGKSQSSGPRSLELLTLYGKASGLRLNPMKSLLVEM
ncbi:hypothetical protein NDU88_007659 [Pleurodeles waltl]|uniref:Reverse transcriptase n=1 Tax=Pleurodeles waltl TaxID=8319 RepID=A0AAV7RTH4_PLEWA|nr:hypothetical protein NDU88_007659 [Pleurodeles waltl]